MSWVDWIGLAVTPWVGAISKKPPRATPKKKSQSAARPARARAKKVTRPAARASARRVTRPQVTPARGRTVTVSVVSPPSPQPSAPVSPASPARPMGRAILISPENEKWVDSLHPTFRWLSVGGATRYEIVWGEDPTLTTHYTLQSIATEATVPLESPLQPGKTYYWRVRGGNESGWSPWSEIHSFRVPEELL